MEVKRQYSEPAHWSVTIPCCLSASIIFKATSPFRHLPESFPVDDGKIKSSVTYRS